MLASCGNILRNFGNKKAVANYTKNDVVIKFKKISGVESIKFICEIELIEILSFKLMIKITTRCNRAVAEHQIQGQTITTKVNGFTVSPLFYSKPNNTEERKEVSN